MTFSEPAWSSRFALRLTYCGKHYFFSRFFFMEKLAQHMQTHYPLIENNTEPPLDHPLMSIADFLKESRRLQQVLSEKEDDKCFEIGGRKIKCQHKTDRYVRDEALYDQYAKKFKNPRGPSYKEIAEFIDSDTKRLSDIEIADQMIHILTGKQTSSDACLILPLLLATLFIAESNRYPSSFLPSLLLIDLIRNQVDTCTFGPYTILNSLTNIELINQYEQMMRLEDIILPQMGLFSKQDLQEEQLAKKEGKSQHVATDRPILYNLGKHRNGHREKEDCSHIKPSDGLLRCAGWWPMTHRFSTTELKKQANYRIEGQALSHTAESEEIDEWMNNQCQNMTHSDVKSFCIMSDWIHHKGMGIPLHMYTVQTLMRRVDFNQNPEILEKLFTELFANTDSLLCTPEPLVLTATGFIQPNHVDYTAMLVKAQEAVIVDEIIDFSESNEEIESDDEIESDEEDTYVPVWEASSILESTQTLSEEQHECYISDDDTTNISLSTWSMLSPCNMRGSPISLLSDSSPTHENIGYGQYSYDDDTSTESTKKSTVSSVRSYKDVLMGSVSSGLNKQNKNTTVASISEPIPSSQSKPKPLCLTNEEVIDLYSDPNAKITQVPLIKVSVR